MYNAYLEFMVPLMVSCPTPYSTKSSTSKKSLPYPIYTMKMNLDVHVQVFHKAIHANGENNDANIIDLLCFTLGNAMFEWGNFFYESPSKM